MSGWAELFQGLQFGLQSSAGGRSPRRCLRPDSAASSESPPLTRTMEKEIKPIEEHREEERELRYLPSLTSEVGPPTQHYLSLLSQSFSPGNFCHLQSEFTKEVVLQKCLLKPPQLTSYLFLISKKKMSFYFHSSSDQTWGWTILFSHLRMILKTVGILDVPFEVHAFGQLVSQIILFVCRVRPNWHSHLSSEDSVKLWYDYIVELYVSL